MVAAVSARRITMTPIPKLDAQSSTADVSSRTPLSRIPRVDEGHCVGCNLCALVCPVPECITMERVENGLPVQAWAERVALGIVPEGVHAPTDLNPNTP